MSANAQRLEALVSDYLASGGQIRKLPDALDATPSDVIRYLNRHKFKIERARANGSEKYSRDGATITLQALVQLANTHRMKQRLPPFDVQSVGP